MKDILKLAKIKGSYTHSIEIIGKLGQKRYYCLTIMYYRSLNTISAFVSASYAIDNTNNHYGIGSASENLKDASLIATVKALKDANLDIGENLTKDNLKIRLTAIAKTLNPEMLFN